MPRSRARARSPTPCFMRCPSRRDSFSPYFWPHADCSVLSLRFLWRWSPDRRAANPLNVGPPGCLLRPCGSFLSALFCCCALSLLSQVEHLTHGKMRRGPNPQTPPPPSSAAPPACVLLRGPPASTASAQPRGVPLPRRCHSRRPREPRPIKLRHHEPSCRRLLLSPSTLSAHTPHASARHASACLLARLLPPTSIPSFARRAPQHTLLSP